MLRKELRKHFSVECFLLSDITLAMDFVSIDKELYTDVLSTRSPHCSKYISCDENVAIIKKPYYENYTRWENISELRYPAKFMYNKKMIKDVRDFYKHELEFHKNILDI